MSDEYDISPDYLWEKFPGYGAFRHKESDKWFALLMDVDSSKLDIDAEDILDIVNVKAEKELVSSLTNKAYILPGYHMNKEHWVSVVLEYLDENSKEHFFDLLTDSFHLTKE